MARAALEAVNGLNLYGAKVVKFICDCLQSLSFNLVNSPPVFVDTVGLPDKLITMKIS